jgi:hypothetical protein
MGQGGMSADATKLGKRVSDIHTTLGFNYSPSKLGYMIHQIARSTKIWSREGYPMEEMGDQCQRGIAEKWGTEGTPQLPVLVRYRTVDIL